MPSFFAHDALLMLPSFILLFSCHYFLSFYIFAAAMRERVMPLRQRAAREIYARHSAAARAAARYKSASHAMPLSAFFRHTLSFSR